VNRPVVLDTSFLVALERETAKGEQGPARRFLPSLRGRPLVVSIVTVEELLEGATDEAAALSSLQRFSIQGLHLAQARRCALLQRRCALLQRRVTRRMGQNDAWLVATAESINADVVGADRIAFERLGAGYLRFR
jgi:predicted nucleic acid-binding protein